MDRRDPEKDVEKIYLKDLQKEAYRLEFLIKSEDAKISKEMEVSVKAGLFRHKDMFRNYLENIDAKHLRSELRDLFKILDTKEEYRDLDEEPLLLEFPYVNGWLFF